MFTLFQILFDVCFVFFSFYLIEADDVEWGVDGDIFKEKKSSKSKRYPKENITTSGKTTLEFQLSITNVKI